MAKESLEEQVKTLQKHVGLIFRTLTDLKSSVEAMEKKAPVEETNEIKEIIEAQRVVEEVIVANADAIKRIDKEMKKTELKINSAATDTSVKACGEVEEVVSDKKKRKKCRYFNWGYCKYTNKCRFVHPLDICRDYLRDNKCERIECGDRHPKRCKWEQSERGCQRGIGCLYLHSTSAIKFDNENSLATKEYKCEGCKYTWNDRTCMQEHNIKNMSVFFCLNCDDWIKNKFAVFEHGWTMFDEAGFLRTDV